MVKPFGCCFSYHLLVIELVPWSDGDLAIAARFLADPHMMVHLGGVQSADKIAQANDRWTRVARSGVGEMFKIVAEGKVVGTIGYWEKDWREQPIYETGWSVFPEHQGRGFALQATLAIIERAREPLGRRWLHAFPHVENEASNAICNKAGFTLLGPVEFEYPPGNFELSNDWQLKLY
jgi:RimJ/RimL family protein N-acetyltransferase